MSVIPSLPQNDPEPEKRRWGIDEMQQMYDYDHRYLAPMAIIKRLPSRDFFSPFIKGTSDRMQMDAGRALAAGSVAAGPGHLDSLDAYDRLLAPYKRPTVFRGHLMDRYFAEQRIAGLNPMKLQRLRELPKDFPFSDAHLQMAFDNSTRVSLEGECNAGRLYVTDYRDFDGLPPGNREDGLKFLPAPLALYCWREGSFGGLGELVPIAISVRPGISSERVIETPRSKPMRWKLAKLAVQIADSNHHEMSSHLCRTHFVMEPVAIATPRHLSFRHPVFVLLRPHLRFTLAQNSYGRDVLMSPGRGIVDRLFGATLDASFSILKNSYDSWTFELCNPAAELDSRGLSRQQDLPCFPYRDDALLLWQAITAFVESYLALYYKSDPADVLADSELQAWATELAAPSGGKLRGFPGQITSRSQLANVLSTIIFTCGPQHAAMNFPQFDFMAHVPNMPLAAYAELPMENATEAEIWERVLPTRELAIAQIQICYTLTAFRHDRLGVYLPGDFEDPIAQPVLTSFFHTLNDVERTFLAANDRRVLPYPYLQPSLVPNSIAI